MKNVKVREIQKPKYKSKFNQLALHPLQSWGWGEFRKKTGLKVERWGIFEKNKLKEPIQVTIHPIPKTKFSIGYFPKGPMPSRLQLIALKKIAKKHNCIFIKLEPKVEKNQLTKRKKQFLKRNNFVLGRPLFTKYNFVLDLSPSEEELLKSFKSKTRYNIRLAQRKGVEVAIDNSDESFETYLKLMKETTKRQGFYAHNEDYHRKLWDELEKKSSGLKRDLLVAKYKGEVITAWMLFQLRDTMYYPYGASNRKYREVMANNLVMWEAIKLAKKRGCKYFDMWGALGLNPDKKDPWYGFHRFKEGYNPRQVEYMGTYDLIIRPGWYRIYKIGEWLRWKWLRLRSR